MEVARSEGEACMITHVRVLNCINSARLLVSELVYLTPLVDSLYRSSISLHPPLISLSLLLPHRVAVHSAAIRFAGVYSSR